MNLKITSIVILSLVGLSSGANFPLPLGVVFDQFTAEVQSAFKFALMTFTPLNVSRYQDRGRGDYGEKFGFMALIDTINTADAYKLSKLICTQFSRGIYAIVGSMNPESFQTYHSYANTFEMPIVVPWYPIKPDKVPEYNSWQKPTAPPRMDFAIRLRPDLHQIILDTIDFYGWKSIIYMYSTNEALLSLQSLLQRLTLTENLLRFTVIKKVSNVQDAIDVLRDVESAERFSPKYVVLDCPINMAKEIIVSHVRNIHLGRRTYHYLLAGLAFDEEWDETSDEFGAVNITGFRMIDPNRKVVKDFLHKWERLDKNQFPGAGRRFISSGAALMFDGMLVIRDAFEAILNDNPRALHRKGGDLQCNSGPGYMDVVSPSEHGRTINGHLRRVHVEGLTGNLQFHENGTRKFFTIDVMELTSGARKLKKVGDWTDHHGFSSTLKNSRNFGISIRRPFGSEDKVYIATAKLGEPYLMRKKTAGYHHLTGNDRFEGFSKDLMDMISHKLNFTYEIKLVSDGREGSENPGVRAGWDGMVGELIRKEADIAMTPIVITADRERVIDFTKPYISSGISIMTFKPKRPIPEVFSFLAPLSPFTWLSCIGAYFCVSLVVYIVARFNPGDNSRNSKGYSKNMKHENNVNHLSNQNSIHSPTSYGNPATPTPSSTSPTQSKGHLSLSNALWYSFCVLTHRHQTASVIKRSWAAKVIGHVWWLFALLLVSAYTANFIALRTRNKIVSPIRSAADLIESGYHNRMQYGTVYASSTYEFFQNSEAQVYRAMFEHMSGTNQMNVQSNEDGIKLVRQKRGKYAFLLDSAINDYTNRRQPCNTMRVGPELNSISYGLATSLQSPLRDRLNLEILRLNEIGVLTHLKKHWWLADSTECNSIFELQEADDSEEELTLSNIAGIFYILIVGLIVALVVSLLEFWHNSRKQAEKSKLTLAEAMKMKARNAITTSDSGINTNITMNSRDVSQN